MVDQAALSADDRVAMLATAALGPLAVIDRRIPAHLAGYVVTGNPQLLPDLRHSYFARAKALLAGVGTLGEDYLSQADFNDLVQAGVLDGKRSVSGIALRKLREPIYQFGNLTAAQLVRYAWLLAELTGPPQRQTREVPDWLTLMLNDLINVSGKYEPQLRDGWTPGFLATLLDAAAIPRPAQPRILFHALFEVDPDRPEGSINPPNLPGVAAHWANHPIPPAATATLSDTARLRLAQRAARGPEFASALSQVLGSFSVDANQGVRHAAVAALRLAPPAAVGHGTSVALATAQPSTVGEVAQFLSETSAGQDILRRATATNSSIAAAVEAILARSQAVASLAVDQLQIPAFEPIPQTSAEPVRAELRAAINKGRFPNVGDNAVDQFIEIIEGRTTADLPFSFRSVGNWVELTPSISLWQLLRLANNNHQEGSSGWLIKACVDPATDARAVAQVLTDLGRDLSRFEELIWDYFEPAGAWGWAAEHLPALAEQLTTAATTTKALQILGEFPALPASLLPTVAAIAVSDSKINRPLAQAVFAGHPAARTLAEQALGDSSGQIRAAAASWLANIGDPAAVPALQQRLAKETNQVARAALMTALEACRQDLSAELSPAILLTEAQKGLRAKVPADLDWFDPNQLPPCRWRDGSQVDPAIIWWWVVLADKLKNPSGKGLIDRYLGLLDPGSAATLGSLVLQAWLAHDTRRASEAESRAHAAEVAAKTHAERQETLQLAEAGTYWKPSESELARFRELAAVPLETHFAEAYAQHQSIFRGTATANKGLLALTTRMSGVELATAATSYQRKRIGQRSQVESLTAALAANGQPTALQVLLGAAQNHQMPSVQKLALGLVAELAEDRGWTTDELADRTVPTAGFTTPGILRLSYGEREFFGRPTPEGKIELRSGSGAGEVISELPQARAGEDPELVSQAKRNLTAARKEAKAVLRFQTSRLYQAMCLQRRWPLADWREYLAGHPLVGTLISRLVWLEHSGSEQRAFRLSSDGGLIDLDDAELQLEPTAELSLAHGSLLDAELAARWRTHLLDYDVVQPFEQFATAAPILIEGATLLDDLRGHLSDSSRFRGVAKQRGYQPGAPADAGWYEEFHKDFAGLTAVISFTGAYLPEDKVACATEALGFKQGRRILPLAAVPPVMLAEAYRDYLAFADLGGYDPNYRDICQG